MTPLTYAFRSGVTAASDRVDAGAMRGALTAVAGASLLVDSDSWPVVAQVGSAAVRMQDCLLIALIAVSVPALARWSRARPAVAALLAILASMLLLSGLRSDVGTSAIVAVAKYFEFVVAGMAIGLAVHAARSWTRITAIFTASCLALAVIAAGDLVLGDGIGGLWRSRSGGPLTFESAAAVASTATVWFVLRLTRLESSTERILAIVGLLAAAAMLVLAKSVLLVGCLAALVALAPALRSRWFRAAAIGCGVLAVAAAATRSSDILAATRGDPSPTPTVALPAEGSPPLLPLAYIQREPASVSGGSFVHRLALAYMGVQAARDAPLLGRGWLTTSNPRFLRDGPYDRYMAERFPRLKPTMFVSNSPTTSHNAYIQTVSEAGIVAGLALVALLVAAGVPAAVMVWRRRTVAPWLQACGLGWLVISAVVLASITLYGGQVEAALLGAAIVVATSGRRYKVGRRLWIGAVVASAAVVTGSTAALVLPAGAASTSSLVRVTAVERSTGTELVREGTQVADARTLELRNGLVVARVVSDGFEIRPTAAMPESKPIVVAAELPARLSAIVVRRQAENVVLELRDGTGGRVGSLTLVRGVPGAYVGVASRRPHLELRAVERVAYGRALEQSLGAGGRSARTVAAETPIAAAGPSSLAGVPLDAALLARRGDRMTLDFLAASGVLFAGPMAPPGTSGGTFLAVPGGESGTRIVRRADASRAGLVPFMLADAHRSGLAESTSLGFTYRAVPPR